MSSKLYFVYAFLKAIVTSFLAINVYWFLTVSYVLPVKEVGQSGVLIGFEAASYLLKKQGFVVYLNGMLGLYILCVICCFGTFIYYKYQTKNMKSIILISLVVGLIGACIYYFFTVNVYVNYMISGESVIMTGKAALVEIGLVQSLFSILGFWVFLFLTMCVGASAIRDLQ